MNKSLTYQEEACLHNKNMVVLCSSEKQRQKILNILDKLNVPISKDVFSIDYGKEFPDLIIHGTHVCGFDRAYSSSPGLRIKIVSETEFVDLFISNKFDIYGGRIFIDKKG